MAVLHITEAELARDVHGVLEKIRQGAEVIVEQDSRPVALPANSQAATNGSGGASKEQVEPAKAPPLESEADALKELRAIPLYFASSHALIKPYVTGFDSNLLDAPSLRRVRMETNWTAPKNANSGR